VFAVAGAKKDAAVMVQFQKDNADLAHQVVDACPRVSDALGPLQLHSAIADLRTEIS
jgi:hypothetical protein